MLKLISSSPRPNRSRDVPSERQLEILRFIHKQLRDQGYPPTVREIGEAVGLRSTNGVAEHLRALIRKGYLAKEDMKSRALVPTPKCYAAIGEQQTKAESLRGLIEVPILGRVAAGVPILAEENVEDVVRLDSYFLGGGRKVFALQVRGDSMIGDGILDGDTLFVRQQDSANRGEIVVFLIEGEATVKRYFAEGDKVRLQPSNPAMAPIYVRKSEFRKSQIAGVVVGVYRKLDGSANVTPLAEIGRLLALRSTAQRTPEAEKAPRRKEDCAADGRPLAGRGPGERGGRRPDPARRWPSSATAAPSSPVTASPLGGRPLLLVALADRPGRGHDLSARPLAAPRLRGCETPSPRLARCRWTRSSPCERPATRRHGTRPPTATTGSPRCGSWGPRRSSRSSFRTRRSPTRSSRSTPRRPTT